MKTKKNKLERLKELEKRDREELLGQKAYLERILEASNKRIENLLLIEDSVRSNSLEKSQEIISLKSKIKKQKKKHKRKLQKKELEYTRQIHLLKSELYDRIILGSTRSEDLKKVIGITSFTKTS